MLAQSISSSVLHSPEVNGLFTEESPCQDLEGLYYSSFEKAYFNAEPLQQIHYLEKLGPFYLEKGDYLKATHVLNSALNAAIDYELETFHITRILCELERIEEEFSHHILGFKRPLEGGYIAKQREDLVEIRSRARQKLDAGECVIDIQRELTKNFERLLIEIILKSIEILGDQLLLLLS